MKGPVARTGRGISAVVARGGRASALALLRFYRVAISPAIGPACRFEPSCSAYAEEAVRRFGVLRGVALAAWRLLRCHPFARGGLDPVPPGSCTHGGGLTLAQERADEA